jgi:hypothetical protein
MTKEQPIPTYLAEFANPSNSFRPRPLFVLNDEYETGPGEKRLTELLENLARVGYGGVFLHPRPGLITEYLSDRWFEIIRHCIAECRRLGLVPALYDENSYPSGFAGGHVPALAPQTAARFLIPKFGALPERPPSDALAVYRTENGIPREMVEPGTLQDGATWCAFVMERMPPMSWHGEFPYTSLLDPKTTQTFLETTYKRYRDELGAEDWKTCAAIFTDEPQLTADSHGPWGPGLHFSRLVQAEFLRRHNYPIETVLADLYFDSPTSAATRFDFYETLHALWMENFALPLEAWCHENSIPLTGHYLEHDWPCPYATPGHVHLLAHMDWPGTDLLECFLLEGHDYGDPQNLDPTEPGTESHALYFLKQVQSVANQLGKKRVMNESWGAGGHDSTPLDWLRIGRFLAVHGVNLFVPHYTTTTIRGARKKDHPQFFSEQSPWFDGLGPLNDELARLAWLAAHGKTRQRILIVDPLTTGYCLSAKSDCVDVSGTSSGQPAHDALADMRTAFAGTQRSVLPLRGATSKFAQALSDAQADFDIGDEYVLAESAAIEADQMRVGEQAYQLVVLPPGLQNLRSASLKLLVNFAANGGKILGVRPETAWLDGRPDAWPDHLPVQWAASLEELLALVVALVPPRLKVSTTGMSGIAHQRRECEEGVYYLIVNSSPSDWSASLSVAEDTNGGRLLDPQTGLIHPFDGQLRIPASEAQILFFAREGTEGPPAVPSRALVGADGEKKSPVEFLGAELLDPNALVIDTCALDVDGQSFPPRLVYESNRVYWEQNGMETNGWANVIQYRDHVISANLRMRPESGGTACYTATILPGTDLASIDLCFECPDQWQIQINGHPLETNSGSRWLDWRIQRVAIGHLLRPGDNSIHLIGHPFDVRQEIDQIYLLGNFSVRPANQGFVLAPTENPIGLGSWAKQGMPFYDRKVSYRFRRPAGKGALRFDKPAWNGSLIEVVLGEKRHQTYGPGLEYAFAATDPEEFAIEITGLPFNLLGPFHKPDLLPKHGWGIFWHGGDVPNDPQPGEAYCLKDFGLFQLPTWSAG